MTIVNFDFLKLDLTVFVVTIFYSFVYA